MDPWEKINTEEENGLLEVGQVHEESSAQVESSAEGVALV